jgi:two-component system alkaline phosphatase synthesis response regulator PhoP
MNVSGQILIIDDEAALRHTLARVLQQAGCDVTTAANGQEGLALLAQHAFDLLYLDIHIPDMNGMEILKTVHAKLPDLPVVLFTAQPDLNSAVEALRQGATDYLLKPLQPQNLIERTQAILMRSTKERRKRQIRAQIDALEAELRNLESEDVPPPNETPVVNNAERFLICGKWVVDLLARRLKIDERAVDLSPTTFDYLLVLLRHAPNVVSYQTLVAEAQGYPVDYREAQELSKWHIHHIRQAIEPDECRPKYILNVRGTGYRLVAD